MGMQMVLCCAGSGCGPEPMLHGTSQSWSLISHPAPAQETPLGTSQVVQWLRLHASNAGGMGLIPGQGTKIPHATLFSQKNLKTIVIIKKIKCYAKKECLRERQTQRLSSALVEMSMEEVEVGAAAGGNRPREEFGLSTSSTSLDHHLGWTQTGDDKASTGK